MTATIFESEDPTPGQLCAATAEAPARPAPGLAPLPDLAMLHAQQQPPIRKLWAERHRGKIGVGLLVPLVMLAAVSPPLTPGGSWSSAALRSLAYTLFLAGGACRFWAMLYIGGRKGLALVSEGPYSIVRNPLYLGTFLMTLSLGVFLENLTSILGCAVISAIYLFSTVPSEERRLAFKRGQAYRDYCRRVPRLWPRPSAFHTSPRISVDLHCLRLEAGRALVWMWIPMVGQLLMTLRLQSWWPPLTWLP